MIYLNILNGVEMPETMTFEDLEVCVDIDQDALVTGESNDDELVQEAKRMRFMKNGNDDAAAADDDDSIPSDLELLKAVKAIRKFAQFRNFKMRFSHWGKLRKKFIGP